MNARAVSPVVGVVLMILLTIALAGTVGYLATGLFDVPDADAALDVASTDESESAAFEFSQNADQLTVAHAGGPTVDVTIAGDVRGEPVAWGGASEGSETIVDLTARDATVRVVVGGETVAEWGDA